MPHNYKVCESWGVKHACGNGDTHVLCCLTSPVSWLAHCLSLSGLRIQAIFFFFFFVRQVLMTAVQHLGVKPGAPREGAEACVEPPLLVC